ncbi:hypothetical protein [Allorhizocola rhizosphaerae]|uniref:hypothetical protein n=1 Tax=Allorhizocola rhizosphaerae TaxID=1872709 RepID=UPI000E3C5E7D|nr:hypothetical protein [Allorhizocola rhizosphaerae]
MHHRGFQPTVVETAPGIRPGGHAVDLRGVAREVVERMGIMPRVRELSVDERGFANVDRHGRIRSRLPADAFGGEGIVAEIEIMRGDLSGILYEATKSFTEYRFGDRNLDNWFLMFNAPGGRCAGIRPERGGTAKASLSFATPPLAYDRRDVAQQQAILREAFAGVGWIVPSLLDSMAGAPDFYFDSVCQVHIGQWSRGGSGSSATRPIAGLR